MKPHEKIYPVVSSRALQTLANDALCPKYKKRKKNIYLSLIYIGYNLFHLSIALQDDF